MPVSEPRLSANRLNALKSTGPRSIRGKAIAAANSIKHGLYAQHLLLEGEDVDELSALKNSILRRVNPRDELELALAERIVVCIWKLRRIQRIERRMHVRHASKWDYGMPGLCENAGVGRNEPIPPELTWLEGDGRSELNQLADHEQRLETSMHRALRQLERIRKVLPDEPLNDFAKQLLSDPTTETQNEPIAGGAKSADTASDEPTVDLRENVHPQQLPERGNEPDEVVNDLNLESLPIVQSANERNEPNFDPASHRLAG